MVRTLLISIIVVFLSFSANANDYSIYNKVQDFVYVLTNFGDKCEIVKVYHEKNAALVECLVAQKEFRNFVYNANYNSIITKEKVF